MTDDFKFKMKPQGEKLYGVSYKVSKQRIVKASSVNFPVFISEYGINDDRFELVFEIKKRSILQIGGNNIKNERLYWNKK